MTELTETLYNKDDELRAQIIKLRKSETAATNEAWRIWEEDGEEISEVEKFAEEIEEFHIGELMKFIKQYGDQRELESKESERKFLERLKIEFDANVSMDVGEK